MKNFKIFSILLIFLTKFLFSSDISWHDNYDNAVKEAKISNRPLVILFTQEGCSWCSKLNHELLLNSDFINEVNNKFVFCRIYFTKSVRRTTEQMQKNYDLKERFKINGFPYLVVEDTEKGLISSLGYLPISGKKYAKKLINSVNECVKIENAFLKTKEGPERDKFLMSLYKKAKKIGCEYFENLFYKEGIRTSQAINFLMDKYQTIVDKGLYSSEEGKEIRRQIDEVKNVKQKEIILKLALIDFQSLAKITDSDEAVQPLIKYIETYGKKDKANLWRLRMIVAQYYLSKGKNEKALEYARASYKSAPKMVKKEITNTILHMKDKISRIK